MITQFESAFAVVAVQFLEEDRQFELKMSQDESTFLASTDSSTLKRHGSGQQIYQSRTAAGINESVYSRVGEVEFLEYIL